MGERKDRGVGGFRILQEIRGGSGSQGTVFKAVCEEDRYGLVPVGTVVALKIMPVQDDEGDLWRKLERRTQELVRLQHPNVVRYFGCFSEPGDFNDLHVVVLEFLDGRTLKQLLAEDFKSGLDVDVGLRIVHSAITGLNYTVQSGIIHRDIKPGNIFICEDGTVKLIDFEIARQEGGTSVSVSGNIRGSFDYMAPDFTDPEFHGDVQSDVFSLGVVMHEVLTGKTPYQRLPGEEKQANFAFLARWAKSGDGQVSNPIHISSRIKRLLAYADEVLLRALAPRREERYPDFAAFLADFKNIRLRDLKNGANTYRILQYIGKGGFGEVYKARFRQTGQLVAVKHLLKTSYADRFTREARTLMKLRDPCFVQFVDFFHIGNESNVNVFLVMAFLDGMPGNSLRDAIRESGEGLPQKDVFLAFERYSYGLGLMHQQGIYHRDIKPSNLYYPRGNPEKSAIMDFGIIRDIHGTQTKDGGVPGTYDYMPPEVILPNNRGDAKMDIFALGLCLYEALTGKTGYPRLPAGNAALRAFFERAKSGEPPVFDDLRVQGEPDVLALLRDMTNPSADLREGEIRRIMLRLQKLAMRAGAGKGKMHRSDDLIEPVTSNEPPTEETNPVHIPVIGGFEVRAQVHNGSGGTGTVYEAVCVNDSSHLVSVGKRVALKIMPDRGDTKGLWPKIQKIADALVRLRDPNVVRYYGCFQYSDTYGRYHVVVQELLEGKSLREIFEERREKSLPCLDVEHTLKIIRATIQGLRATTQAGIIHRDIKPGNIFICDDGSVKVIDFEIALQENPDGTASTTTGNDSMKGSWNYMAPDFLREGFRGDVKSDIFSLGVVLYESLAGKLPHDRVGDLGEFLRLWEGVVDGGKESPIHIDERIEGLLENGHGFFESALHWDRKLRYPDFESFERDLRLRELKNGKYTYRILRYVDHGGYATVYEAKRIDTHAQKIIEAHVAVKQLDNVSAIKKFEQEARTMMDLYGDERFTRYIDFFQPPLGSGRGFLVMEFLDGMPENSLRGAIKRSRAGLPPRDVFLAFARYASGLRVLHKRGIIHRDIKPSNLYYPAGHPEESKIMDLGIVRDVDATGTPTPGACGTPDYMPADSLENRDDKSRDIFALGLCLYEALTTKPGYPRLKNNRFYLNWLKQREKTPVFEDPRVRKNTRLLGLLQQMTNLDAKKRGTAEDVYQALRELAVTEGVKEEYLRPLDEPKKDVLPIVIPSRPSPPDNQDPNITVTIDSHPDQTPVRFRKWALVAVLVIAVSGVCIGTVVGVSSFQAKRAEKEKDAIVSEYKQLDAPQKIRDVDRKKDKWERTWNPLLAGWVRKIPRKKYDAWVNDLAMSQETCRDRLTKVTEEEQAERDTKELVEDFLGAKNRAEWENAEARKKEWGKKWSSQIDAEKYKELLKLVLDARNKADARIKIVEASNACEVLVEDFGEVRGEEGFKQVKARWEAWRKDWNGKLADAKYAELDGRVQYASDAAESRLRQVKQCDEAKKQLIDAFQSAADRGALEKAYADWKAWQTAWKEKVDQTIYIETNGRIKEARDAAEKRILETECRVAADFVIKSFRNAENADDVKKAKAYWDTWGKRWNGKIDGERFNGFDQDIRIACEAAEIKIDEGIRKLARACEERVNQIVNRFAAAESRQDLQAAVAEEQRWRDEWKAKIDERVVNDFYQKLEAAHEEAELRLDSADAVAESKAIIAIFKAVQTVEGLDKADDEKQAWEEKWSKKLGIKGKEKYTEIAKDIQDACDAAMVRIKKTEDECRKTAEELQQAFRGVTTADDLAVQDQKFRDWQKVWRGAVSRNTYDVCERSIAKEQQEKEKQILDEQLRNCRESVAKLVAEFEKVKLRDELTQLENAWKAWQGAWKGKVDEKIYAQLDRSIQTARDDAEGRIQNTADCTVEANGLIGAFRRTENRTDLEEADKRYQTWQDAWKDRKLVADTYVAWKERIQVERAAAERRIALREAKEAADGLVAIFGKVETTAELEVADKDYRTWQNVWKARLGADEFAVQNGRIQVERAATERRIALQEAKEAADGLVAIFVKVETIAELEAADKVYRTWQNVWKGKFAEGEYANLDGSIEKAKVEAGRRVGTSEARSAAGMLARSFGSAKDEGGLKRLDAEWQEWREKWTEKIDGAELAKLNQVIQDARKESVDRLELLGKCREEADNLIRSFGAVKVRSALEETDREYRVWQNRWNEKLAADTHAEINGRIKGAHDEAEIRVVKLEKKQMQDGCKAVSDLFRKVKTGPDLDRANAAFEDWQKKWKDFSNEAEYGRVAAEIRDAKGAAEKRMQEIEKERTIVREAYESALGIEPLAERRKRLENAKGRLAASKERSLFSEAETERMLAEIERRRSWTVGKIANRTGNAVTVGGTNIAAGTTATVVFEKGTSWPVTRKGYEPGTVKRESLDGETVTLADDAFVPSEVTVKLPDGLDAGVVCDLDGRVVGAAGVPVNPGRHICAYRRAGYDPQEGISFDVAVGAEDARFPVPGGWTATPVKVTVPKLGAGVTCEMAGKPRVSGVSFTLVPGKNYPYVYRRAGWRDQPASLTLRVGEDAVLPPPAAWDPLPVKVTVPRLDKGVTCEVGDALRKTGDVFELTPREKPYPFIYRKADRVEQKGMVTVRVNTPLSLPVPGEWEETAGLQKLNQAANAVEKGDWADADKLLNEADVEDDDNQRKKAMLRTQVENSKKWAEILDEISELEMNKETVGDSIAILERYRKIAGEGFRLRKTDRESIDVVYKFGVEDCKNKKGLTHFVGEIEKKEKKLEKLYRELLGERR